MALIDMFEKLDDVIYKPIETICDWINEPLRKMEHKRNLASVQQAANIDETNRRLETELRQSEERHKLEIHNATKRADIELDNFAADSRLARNQAVVESIKHYQMDLATTTQEIIMSVGKMSMVLRTDANNMLLEKTRAYKALQDEAIDIAGKRLEDIAIKFENNERVRVRMEDAIIGQMESIIIKADQFMLELSDDLKKLNSNIDQLTNKSMETIDTYLKPLARGLGRVDFADAEGVKQVEQF